MDDRFLARAVRRVRDALIRISVVRALHKAERIMRCLDGRWVPYDEDGMTIESLCMLKQLQAALWAVERYPLDEPLAFEYQATSVRHLAAEVLARVVEHSCFYGACIALALEAGHKLVARPDELDALAVVREQAETSLRLLGVPREDQTPPVAEVQPSANPFTAGGDDDPDEDEDERVPFW